MNVEEGQIRPGPRQQMSPEVAALQKKAATAQLANQIYMNLIMEPGNQTLEPVLIVDRAFSLAEAFDKKLEAYMLPPKIMSVPPGTVIK